MESSSSPSLELPLDRRGFLRLCSGAGLALAAAPILATGCATYPTITGLKFFTNKEFTIASSMAEAVLPPDADAAGIIHKLDALLVANSTAVQDDTRMGLLLLEHGSAILNLTLSRFSRLTVDARRAVLQEWLTDGFALQRAVVSNFKRTAFFLYYAQPSVWERLGYDGPWVRPEQVWRP